MQDEENFIQKKIKIEWGPGNHSDITNNIAMHYKKHVLSEEGKYWNHISLTEYENYPINHFYDLKDVCVHTNGRRTYLSGFHNNIFIIGRYHNDIFGISSCYYVENSRKPCRYKNLCFELSFLK